VRPPQAKGAALNRDRLQRLLRTERLGRSLEVRLATESTMDDARRVAESVPDGHVVLADHQQSGRGAHGRRWESPPGTDLYLSIVLRSALPDAARPLVTLAVGLGVADAAEHLSGRRAFVKWPNDVWLAGKKCAGILVETRSEGGKAPAVIVGIGLNVNRRTWPTELQDVATSLALAREDGADVDRARAFATLMVSVEEWLDRLVSQGAASIIPALSQRLALLGKEVLLDDTRGTLLGIADNGALRLATADGITEHLAGTLRPA
jgi:BirA family transcriptional regulator, biotin operon repressor / biotin---[acetyl-CoA-carboxylase] ligase